MNYDEFSSVRREALLLDVRREEDYSKSEDILPGSEWKNPAEIDQWINTLPKDRKVAVYCVHGGSVSKSVVERLQSDGVDASYIEGGIEGVKSSGGRVEQK
jgi:rhodanese-related sulfurtransferase